MKIPGVNGIVPVMMAVFAVSATAETTKLRSSGEWFDEANWNRGIPGKVSEAIVHGEKAVIDGSGAAADKLFVAGRDGIGRLDVETGDLNLEYLAVGGETGIVNQAGGHVSITYNRSLTLRYVGFEPEKAADYYERYLRFMKEQGFEITYLDTVNEATRLFTPAGLSKFINILRERMGDEMPIVIAPSSIYFVQAARWIEKAIEEGHAGFWEISSSHNGSREDPGILVRAVEGLDRPIWNTELHGLRGPDDKAAEGMKVYFDHIRAGFSGLNPWLSMGNTKKDYKMFRNVSGKLELMRIYYIYRHLANTSNDGRYLESDIPEGLASTVAFYSEKKNLVTVWALNGSDSPTDVFIKLKGRYASCPLAEARWWGPDNEREGSAITEGLSGTGCASQTIPGHTLYCFSFNAGESGKKSGELFETPSGAAIVKVEDAQRQEMKYGHDFERLWHFTDKDGSKYENYDELARWAVGECDVHYLRVAISAAAEPEEGKLNWSVYDRQLAIMRAMKRVDPDIKFFASPRPVHNDLPVKTYCPFPVWVNVFENPYADSSRRNALQVGGRSATGIYNVSGGTTVVNCTTITIGDAGYGEVNVSGSGLLRVGARVGMAASGGTAVLNVTGGEFRSNHLVMGGKKVAGARGTIHVSGGRFSPRSVRMDGDDSCQLLRISGTNSIIQLNQELALYGDSCVLHVELDSGGVSTINVGGKKPVRLDGTLKVGKLGNSVPDSVTLIRGGTSIEGEFGHVAWEDGVSGKVVYDRDKREVRLENLES